MMRSYFARGQFRLAIIEEMLMLQEGTLRRCNSLRKFYVDEQSSGSQCRGSLISDGDGIICMSVCLYVQYIHTAPGWRSSWEEPGRTAA
jgi:hypothetical protein